MSVPKPNPVYRETFLRERFKPDRRRSMRRHGEILEALTSEAVAMVPRGGDIREDLEAVAVDLGCLSGLLEDPVRDDDVQLERRSLRWADRLREVEAEIRAALDQEARP